MEVRWVVPPAKNLIERAPVQEFYCDGQTAIHVQGDDVCFILSRQLLPIEQGSSEPFQDVQVRIIKPIRLLPMVMMDIARCMCPIVREGEPPPCMPWQPRIVG